MPKQPKILLFDHSPHLRGEWDMRKNSVDPKTVEYSSSLSVYWTCNIGHTWKARIVDRVSRLSTRCPVCSNRKLLIGFNDLQHKNRELSSEMYDSKFKPNELKYNSHTKVDWRCSSGHIWNSSVVSRYNGSGCPKCSLNHTSKIEKRLRKLLTSSYNVISSDHTYRLDVPYRKNSTMSVDIYMESPHKTVVEYDGAYFHQSEASISRDVDKATALLNAEFFLIRVRESPLSLLKIEHPNLFQLSIPYSKTDEHLIKAVEQIKEWLETKTSNSNIKPKESNEH